MATKNSSITYNYNSRILSDLLSDMVKLKGLHKQGKQGRESSMLTKNLSSHQFLPQLLGFELFA